MMKYIYQNPDRYETRKRTIYRHNSNGVCLPETENYTVLKKVTPEVEKLAKKLFDITSKYQGSLMVDFEFQPSHIRELHHCYAEVILNEKI